MKKKLFLAGLLSLLLAAGLVLTGCKQEAEEDPPPPDTSALVGKWGVNGEVLYEFTSAGKLIIPYEEGEDDDEVFDYKGTDADTITVSLTEDGQTVNVGTLDWAVSGTTLILSNGTDAFSDLVSVALVKIP
ncbi:MAG: hypothetical protein LBP20_01680 [Treponema sp.]|nr:hypothetical protein [Treponema sp.]